MRAAFCGTPGPESHGDRRRQTDGIDGQIVEQSIDHLGALGCRGFGRTGRWWHAKPFQRIDQGVQAGQRGKGTVGTRRIELRILVEMKLVGDLAGQIARGQNLYLVLQRGRIRRQVRQHRRRVGHRVLALIEHHHGGGRIGRRQQHQNQDSDADYRQRDAQDQAATFAHDAEQIVHREGRVFGRCALRRSLRRNRSGPNGPVGRHERASHLCRRRTQVARLASGVTRRHLRIG